MLTHFPLVFSRGPSLSRDSEPRALAPREEQEFGECVFVHDQNAAYLGALDQLICDLVARNISSFAELSRSCAGAWPGLLADRVSKLNLRSTLTTEPASLSLPSYFPELHCGFGEWYFSSESADLLAREFISKQTFSLLLGTPTIAQRAHAVGAGFTLVDNNPFVGMRFPMLKPFIYYSSVEQLKAQFPYPSTIMLDAPWYLPRIRHWLSKASQLATKSTVIVMPLFRSLTRPSANHERSIILDFADSIGRAEIVQDCISYESPLYEWEALLSHNVFAHPAWRRADLLIIREPSPLQLPDGSVTEPQAIWETYLIGGQVVRLRLHPIPRRRKFLIGRVPQTRNYILDTVSARDERKEFIDLWTSRNRVAVVGDVRRLRYIFSVLTNLANATSSNILTTLQTLLSESEMDDFSRLLSLDTVH
jgi:hypothetical protein